MERSHATGEGYQFFTAQMASISICVSYLLLGAATVALIPAIGDYALLIPAIALASLPFVPYLSLWRSEVDNINQLKRAWVPRLLLCPGAMAIGAVTSVSIAESVGLIEASPRSVPAWMAIAISVILFVPMMAVVMSPVVGTWLGSAVRFEQRLRARSGDSNRPRAWYDLALAVLPGVLARIALFVVMLGALWHFGRQYNPYLLLDDSVWFTYLFLGAIEITVMLVRSGR